MQAIVMKQFGEPAEVLNVEEIPTPAPGPGDVRVRMLAAAVNPSDLMMIRGTYGHRPELPTVPGYEGMGVVEASGGGLLPRILKGKRVAVGHRTGGTWAEFAVIPAKQAVPLPKAIPDDQGAMFLVNPVTAFVMTRRVLRVPTGDWLLQTAAGSALGKMVIRLSKRFGFRTMNIVRREEQVDELKQLGADAVIAFDASRDDPDKFRERVLQATGDDGVQFAIDPVGGAMGSAVANCLGKFGRMLVFGTLSGEPYTISARPLIGQAATISGFWLTNYLDSLGLLGKIKLVSQVGKLIRQNVLTTEIGETYPLSEIATAVQTAEQRARGGKVLLRIGP